MDGTYPGISKYQIIVLLHFHTIIKYSNLTFMDVNDPGPPNPIKMTTVEPLESGNPGMRENIFPCK